MKIIGTGSAHPKCAVTNEMLEKFLETTDEWITERTGIKERLVISSEKLEDLAVIAANKALDDANLTAADIDFIICSNVVNEYVTPALSCIIQGKLGAKCPTVAFFVYRKPLARRVVLKKANADDEKITPSGIVEVRSGNCKLQHRGRSFKNERHKQFISYEMELQIPHRICAEISAQSVLPRETSSDRKNTATIM